MNYIIEEEETALAATGMFKGRCYVCGKMGHKGIYCPDRKDAKQNQKYLKKSEVKYNGPQRNARSMICSYCSKQGHTDKNCWINNDDMKSAKVFLASVEDDENKNMEEETYEEEELVMASIEENKSEETNVRPS